MRVLIHSVGAGVSVHLAEGDDFTTFSVEVDDAVDLNRAAELLTGQVRFGSDVQAWVDHDWLVRAGGYNSGPRADAFAAMVAYAARKDWVDPVTQEIAGHVTRRTRNGQGRRSAQHPPNT
ncbi:hypothetical protein ACFZCY_31430 [Streptomyces sp. NPDC007983]|uniref:hypothetical protein n=1 Tax=Streptomyces sp. NPDC007983 TaxID=3364800 RepID=UPI0036E365B4